MGATLTSIANALKLNYYGTIVDRLNNTTPYYSQLQKTSEFVSSHGQGIKAYFPYLTRNNQGIGTRAENAALPTARQTTTIQMNVDLKYLYGEFRFTGQALAGSSKDATRFAEVIDLETKSLTTSMRNEVGMQVITPSSGMLGIANGAGAGADATVTVDGPGTIWLRRGMPIETRAYSVSTGVGTVSAAVADQDISQGLTEATSHQVGAIANNKLSFELEDYAGTAVTTEKWSDNRIIFRYGSVTTDTTPSQMSGLLTIIDNYALSNAGTSSWFSLAQALITVQGQSRGTYTQLDANIIHNSGTNQALSEELIQEALDKVSETTGDESHASQMLLMDYAMRRTFINILQADRQFSPQTLVLKGGWKVTGYQAGNSWIPIVVDRQVPSNCIIIPKCRFMKIFRFKDFDWMDKDGSMFERASDSSGRYDAYTATMYIYMEQATTSYQDHVAIRDIGTL